MRWFRWLKSGDAKEDGTFARTVRGRKKRSLAVEILEKRETPANLSVANVNMVEGNSGSPLMNFTITRTGVLTQPTSVGYKTVDGTATAGIDYVAQQGRAQFLAGVSTATVSIPIMGETFAEQNEDFQLQLSAPEPTFGAVTNFNNNPVAGYTSYSVAQGDLNSDGRPDLVTISRRAAAPPLYKMSVLLNITAPGSTVPSYTPVAAMQNFDTVPLPGSVLIQDINRDGRADVVVGSSIVGNGIQVFLQGNPPGPGSLAFTRTDYAGPDRITGPHAMQMADINGDTRQDLVVVSTTGQSMSIYLGTTTAPFLAAPQNTSLGFTATGITINDFDGDGRPDIAVIKNSAAAPSVLSVFTNATSPGSNVVGLTRTDVQLPSPPRDIASADMNGDGKPDLVVALGFSNSVGVLLNQTPAFAANPLFNSPQIFSTGGTANTVVTRDLNGDGLQDIVSSVGSGVLTILMNSSPLTTGFPLTMAAQSSIPIGATSNYVVVSDVNGDGRPDLASANSNGTTSVLLNTTDVITVSSANGNIINDDTGIVTVTSIARVNADPTSSNVVSYSVNFNTPVVGVDLSDFALTTTGTVAGASILSVVSTGTISFNVTVNTGTGSGTLRLDLLDDDTITDNFSVELGGPGPGNGDFTIGDVYSIDKTPPSVVSIVRGNADPSNAATLTFVVNFDENVTGVDTSDFTLTTTGLVGASIFSAVPITSNSYRVSVASGAGSGTIRLNLNDNDTIRDSVNNRLGGTGTGNGSFLTGEFYTIDRVGPMVASSLRANPNPTNATSVNFTVTFNEAVTGIDIGDFSLSASGLSGTSIQGVTQVSPTTYTVGVNAGSGTGTLRLNILDNDSILDVVGNKLGGTGVGNGNYLVGEFYSIDRSSPLATRIVRASANPAPGPTADFTVTFNKGVTGVDISDFTLVPNAVANASILSVTPINSFSYTVTVNVGDGNGTLRLDLIDDDTIRDSFNNPLGGNGLGNANFTNGEVYTVQRPFYVVSSIARANPNPTAASTVDYTVTFTGSVSGVDAGDFSFTTTGIAGASVASITPGPGSVYTVSVNVGAGNGTLRLDLVDNDSIVDATGRPLGGTGAGNANFNTGEFYTIDRSPPAVQSIVRADTNPTNAATVRFTVTLDKAVTGVDAGDFNLTAPGITGASITSVTPVSGTVYTVAVTTGANDGTIRLDLIDNDSILDAFNNPLGGPGAGNGNFTTGEFYNLVRSGPVVQSFSSPLANTNQATVQYDLAFNIAVTGVDIGDFSLNPGTTTASIASVTEVDGSHYTVLVNTGTGDSAIALRLVDNDSIIDGVGNPLGGIGGVGSAGDGSFLANSVNIDKTAPTATLQLTTPSPTGSTTVNYQVTFSEPIAGLDASDFTISAPGLNGSSIASITPTGALTYDIAVNTGSGQGQLQLNLLADGTILDPANNPLASGAGGAAITVDNSVPTVQAVVRVGNSPINAPTITFRVDLSENVAGVDLGDFILTTTGVTGASVTSVSAINAGSYQVLVNTGVGSGTIRLDLIDDDTIMDPALNPLGGVGAGNGNFSAGEIFTIDKTPPVVASSVRVQPNPASSSVANFTLDFTVTLSEDVTGVDLGDFSLSANGIAGSTLAGITTVDAHTYTVTVNVGLGTGTLRLNVLDNDTIQDLAGNSLGGPGTGNGAFFTGEFYAVTHVLAPSVARVTIDDGTGQRSMIRSITVEFDKTVQIQPGAFSLVRQGGAATVLGTTLYQANNRTYVVLSFAGSNVFKGSLIDGTYTLTIDASKVRDSANLALSSNFSTTFTRRFGDVNGDGVNNNTDTAAFLQAYGSRRGYPKYLSYFDYDNDGDVDNADFYQIRLR